MCGAATACTLLLLFRARLVLGDSRLDELLDERGGKRLVCRKTNGAFGGLVTAEFLLVRIYNGRAGKNAAVVLERRKADHHAVVFVHRHLVADSFRSHGRGGFDRPAQFHKRGARFFGHARKILVHISCRSALRITLSHVASPFYYWVVRVFCVSLVT